MATFLRRGPSTISQNRPLLSLPPRFAGSFSLSLRKDDNLPINLSSGVVGRGNPRFNAGKGLRGQTWGELRIKRRAGEGDALAAMRMPMGGKVISRRIDARKVTIKMVDGSLIQAKVNVYHDEEVVQRVSDIFTKVTDPFIVVFDATAEGRSGRVLIINKSNIAWVSPEDEPVRQEDEKPAESRSSWMERMRKS